MKRLVRRLLLIVVMILICTNSAFAATYPCDGQVLKNAVNVRKKASQGSDQVGKLKKDEIVTVIGEQSNGNTVWYQIEFGKGKTGYVREDLIRLNEHIESVIRPSENHMPNKEDSVINQKMATTLKNIEVTQSVFEKSNPDYDLFHEYGLIFIPIQKSQNKVLYGIWSRELDFSGHNAKLTILHLNTSGVYYEAPPSVVDAITEFIYAYLKAAGYTDIEIPVSNFTPLFLESGMYIAINGYVFRIAKEKEKTIVYDSGEFYEADRFCVNVSKADGVDFEYGQYTSTKKRYVVPTVTDYKDDTLTLPSYNSVNSEPIDLFRVSLYGSCNYDENIRSIVMGAYMSGVSDIYDTYKVFPNLENFVVSNSHPYLATIDGCLYNKEEKTLIACPPQKKELIIPEGILGIDVSACENTNLVSVSIPSSCIRIGGGAFEDCKNLKDVVFVEGSSLEFIGKNAFNGCVSVSSIDLKSEKNVEIDSGAFANCTALESINMTDTACALIGEKAFEGCTNLSKVLFPDKLISIGANAFSGCPVRTVDLSEGLESIGSKAFDALEKAKLPVSLQSFEYDSFNPSCQLTVAEGNEMYYENEGGVFSQDHVLVYYPYEAKKDVTAYEISEGTTAVICPMGSYIKRLIVPSTVTSFKNFSTTATLIVDSGSYAESFAIKNKYNYETRIVEGNDLSWLSATPVPSPTPVPTPTYTMSPASEAKQLNSSSFDLQIESSVATSGFSDANVGDYITFGSYEQDGNEGNGKEPIEWVVLEIKDDKMLMLSKYGIDHQVYHLHNEEITWENCSLRKWANEVFPLIAFTDAERMRLLKTIVPADDNPQYDVDPGNPTEDLVFLLSITEAEKYFSANEQRNCVATAYADARGLYTDDNYMNNRSCYWLLRTPGDRPNYRAFVNSYGIIEYDGSWVSNDGYSAFRPAIWVSVK